MCLGVLGFFVVVVDAVFDFWGGFLFFGCLFVCVYLFGIYPTNGSLSFLDLWLVVSLLLDNFPSLSLLLSLFFHLYT